MIDAQLRVFAIKVALGQVLRVPLGYLIACAVLEDELCVGLRRCSLFVCACVSENFGAQRQFHSDVANNIGWLNCRLRLHLSCEIVPGLDAQHIL